MSGWNDRIIEEFRANGGAVAAFAHQPLLLLTHTGAKSGIRRVNPVAYFRDGDRYLIVASKGGAPTNPDWYHNLLANPRATVEVGTETFEVTAEPVEGPDRGRIWTMITAQNPAFATYEGKTERTIPVVALTPVE